MSSWQDRIDDADEKVQFAAALEGVDHLSTQGRGTPEEIDALGKALARLQQREIADAEALRAAKAALESEHAKQGKAVGFLHKMTFHVFDKVIKELEAAVHEKEKRHAAVRLLHAFLWAKLNIITPGAGRGMGRMVESWSDEYQALQAASQSVLSQTDASPGAAGGALGTLARATNDLGAFMARLAREHKTDVDSVTNLRAVVQEFGDHHAKEPFEREMTGKVSKAVEQLEIETSSKGRLWEEANKALRACVTSRLLHDPALEGVGYERRLDLVRGVEARLGAVERLVQATGAFSQGIRNCAGTIAQMAELTQAAAAGDSDAENAKTTVREIEKQEPQLAWTLEQERQALARVEATANPNDPQGQVDLETQRTRLDEAARAVQEAQQNKSNWVETARQRSEDATNARDECARLDGSLDEVFPWAAAQLDQIEEALRAFNDAFRAFQPELVLDTLPGDERPLGAAVLREARGLCVSRGVLREGIAILVSLAEQLDREVGGRRVSVDAELTRWKNELETAVQAQVNNAVGGAGA
jgi:hypothetical protein